MNMDMYEPFVNPFPTNTLKNKAEEGKNMTNNSLENFPIYGKLMELVVRSDKYIASAGSNYRTYVGLFRDTLTSMLKDVCVVNITTDIETKIKHLESALSSGDYLKCLVRIMFSLKVISQEGLDLIDEYLGSINSQFNGWLGSVKSRL